MQRTVYIVNRSSHDFSAQDYGKLVYVTEGRVNRFAANDMVESFRGVQNHNRLIS